MAAYDDSVKYHSMKHLPNIFTFFRILALPLIALLYFLQPTYSADVTANTINTWLVILLSIASITDFLDGYLARKYHATSKLGEFLDPVADKIFVVTALLLLVDYYSNWLVTLCAIIIIMREIVVSAMREWLGQMGKRAIIKVSYLGKVKTTTQIFALLFLFYQGSILDVSSYSIGIVLLVVATFFTIVSGMQYLLAFLTHM